MEITHSSRKQIFTRISFVSNIMVYYGYMHHCAELFRQLGKESREGWDKNIHAIIKVIMKHSNNRGKLQIKKPFGKSICDYLLKDHKYSYFSLTIHMRNDSNLKAGIEFLNSLDIYSDDLFDRVDIAIKFNQRILKSYNEFGELFLEKRFKMEQLQTKFIKTNSIKMTDFYAKQGIPIQYYEKVTNATRFLETMEVKQFYTQEVSLIESQSGEIVKKDCF